MCEEKRSYHAKPQSAPRKELKEIDDGNWYFEIPDLEGVWLNGISAFEVLAAWREKNDRK